MMDYEKKLNPGECENLKEDEKITIAKFEGGEIEISECKVEKMFNPLDAEESPAIPLIEIKSEIPKKIRSLFPQMQRRPLNNIASSALKTSLSDVLRRNIECDKVSNFEESSCSTSQSAIADNQDIGNENKNNASDTGVISQKVNAELCFDAQTSETNKKTLHSDDKNNEVVRTKPLLLPSFNPSETEKIIDKEIPLSGNGELLLLGASDGPIIQLVESLSSYETALLQKEKVVKGKRIRKRHFKGATYNLYLSKKKRKQQLKPLPDSNARDDASLTSTENGNDSSDLSSELSEYFNTSEKSLMDDEACSNSRCSPILHESNADVSDQREGNDTHDSHNSESECIRKVVLKTGDKEKDIENAQLNLSVDEILETNSQPLLKTSEVSALADVSSSIKVNSRKCLTARKKYASTPSFLPKLLMDLPSSSKTDLEKQPDEENEIEIKAENEKIPYILNDNANNFKVGFNTEASIAPFPHMSPIFCSKLKPIDYCVCVGETLDETNVDKPSCFFCQAVDLYDNKLVGCSNPVTTFELRRPSVRIPFTVMCEMHLWRLTQHHCCPRCGLFCTQGPVIKCVPMKDDPSVIHLFHEQCQGNLEEGDYFFCLHCGKDSNLERSYLSCELASPPSFFQSQLSAIFSKQARITLSAYKEKYNFSKDVQGTTFKIARTGAILNTDLLPEKEMAELEAMLFNLNTCDLPDLSLNSSVDFYTATLQGDVERILLMLAKGFNPNRKFPEHDMNTALHAAAFIGNISIIHLLLQAGSESDTMNGNLRTPLMLATENNKSEAIKALIIRDAPINTKGEVGMTCLHLASRDGLIHVVQILLDSCKTAVNLQDDGGWTPIVWASEHGHKEIVALLIENGGQPNIRDNEGNTALHWAAFCGTAEVCIVLLNFGCILDETNNHGDTPLHIACRQDNFECVDLFLARSSNTSILNSENETPIDCCKNNVTCRSYKTMLMTISLKKIFKFYEHKSEKVLFNDITLGREKYPIRCINAVDDIKLDLNEFLYVTENCQTTQVDIDCSINSLQHCDCKDDCVNLTCTCSSISFKCWYDKDGCLLPDFNMFDPPLLFECNRACKCHVSMCRNRVVQRGMSVRLELMRTEGRGWGVRAMKDIPKGSFICEYVGEIISDSEADTREDDSYLFDLDNKDGETYCLDARHFGNISRFINHLCEPNLIPVKVFVDHQDLSYPRIAFFNFKEIHQYEELGFDYGEKFWVIKSKSFTCNCGSPKCKYSEETIWSTLNNYYAKAQNEMIENSNSLELTLHQSKLEITTEVPEKIEDCIETEY